MERTKKMGTELATIIQGQREQFLQVATDKHINFDREAQFALQMLESNDFLSETAIKNITSLRNAINNIAAIGISLNPAEKLAYLVPRKGAIWVDISYMGLLNAAITSGSIAWGQARLVREGDQFELQGVDQPPLHSHNPFAEGRDECAITGAYIVVKTDKGDYLTHAMTIKKIYDIRDRSELWKKKKSGPWATDEEEMIKKTCVKQAYKYWPRRKKLDEVIHYLNTTGGEGINFADNEPKLVKGDHTPSTGAMSSLDEKKQNESHDLATEVADLYNDGHCWQAMDKMHDIQTYEPVPEFGIATWHLLASNIRTGLKKYEESERKGERGEDE